MVKRTNEVLLTMNAFLVKRCNAGHYHHTRLGPTEMRWLSCDETGLPKTEKMNMEDRRHQ